MVVSCSSLSSGDEGGSKCSVCEWWSIGIGFWGLERGVEMGLRGGREDGGKRLGQGRRAEGSGWVEGGGGMVVGGGREDGNKGGAKRKEKVLDRNSSKL